MRGSRERGEVEKIRAALRLTPELARKASHVTSLHHHLTFGNCENVRAYEEHRFGVLTGVVASDEPLRACQSWGP